MAQISPSLPVVGQPDSTEEPKVITAMQAILGVLNGGVDFANISTDLQNRFLKLSSVADLTIAYGTVATPPAFNGGRNVALNIAHGLGVAPVYADVTDSWVTDNTSGQNQPVVSAISGMDVTNIGVQFFLPPGITAAVGPGQVWWVAIG